jgi:hypothetical protein
MNENIEFVKDQQLPALCGKKIGMLNDYVRNF